MAKYRVLGTVISYPSDTHFYAGEIVENFPKNVEKMFLEANQIELVESLKSSKSVTETSNLEITSETVVEKEVID